MNGVRSPLGNEGSNGKAQPKQAEHRGNSGCKWIKEQEETM